VFLLVAAFLVNITLSRLIALEREQIGLMKALGYSSWAVARHYIELVLLIALAGCAIGFVGGYWLGTQLTLLYAKFYSFPLLIFSRDPGTYVIAGGTTMGAGMVGAVNAVRKAAWLPPAVAMSPPAPPDYRQVLGSGMRQVVHLRQTSVIALRHLLRWPWRSAGGVLGIALSVAILVGSLWTVGAMEHMIQMTFNLADRQDATLAFEGQRTPAALFAVERLPGVLRAEPYRSVGVEISSNQVSRRVGIVGRPLDADLSRVVDEDGRTLPLPQSGLVLSKSLADILGVSAGSAVWIRLLEGDRRELSVPVSDVVEGFMGLGAYMELDALNRLVGDGSTISGANLMIDPVQQADLFSVLKRTPSAGYIALQSIALKQFRSTQVQNLFVMIGVLAGLAGLIAFGVVYNFARISLSEQGREMASLRVLGFTRGEVSSLLLGEIAIVTLLAQPIGWAIGYLIALAMVAGFSNEVYRMALILGPEVYAYSSLVVCVAAFVSGLVVRRRVDRLDLIAVLKTRE
jgi:putative ABC transport system permease protein